jgi:hypothetical protein
MMDAGNFWLIKTSRHFTWKTLALLLLNVIPIAALAAQSSNTFVKPSVKGVRVDWCRTWAKDCGGPAASLFCREMGFSEASKWSIDRNIGAQGVSTLVLGDGKICQEPNCSAFGVIVCATDTSKPASQEQSKPAPEKPAQKSATEVASPPMAIITVSPDSVRFVRPQIKGILIDRCSRAGKDCGKPAADLFCREQKFGSASKFSIDKSAGRRGLQTIALRDGHLCKSRRCQAFQSITCVREIAPVQADQKKTPIKGSTYRYVATTLAPAKRQGSIPAGGVNWNCRRNSCTTLAPWPKPSVSVCAALAREVGRIASFGREGVMFDATGIRLCASRATASGTIIPGPSLTDPGIRPPAGELGRRVALREHLFETLQQSEIRRGAAAEIARQQAERLRNWPRGPDCDDTSAEAHPGNPEVCDRLDNNCDGHIDEDQTLRRYLDADGDGHGNPERRMDVCADIITYYAREAEASGTGGGWLVEVGNDCDDADPTRWSGC